MKKQSIVLVALVALVACIEQAPEEKLASDGGGGEADAGLAIICDGAPGDAYTVDAQIFDAQVFDAQVVDAQVSPTCAEYITSLDCTTFGCHWWRAAGESVRCHDEARPASCDQPDGPTCEAAGCEWTGSGCGPSLETACSALDGAACARRPDCVLTDMACAARPDAACQELALGDCRARLDCGWLGAACTDLDQGPCPGLIAWACGERQDCQPIVVEGPECEGQPKDQAPAAPDAGAGGAGGGGGGGGAGGAGGAGEFVCVDSTDCGAGWICDQGTCLRCGDYLGCRAIESP